jgi:hypothetical protein
MSIPTTGWHAEAPLLDRYVAGTLDSATAASIEAHVVKCATCRATLATRAPQPRLAAVWSEVVEHIDDPRPGFIERGLMRLGLSESDARLAACVPALRLAWLLALVAVLLFCVVAADAPRVGPNLFLVLAPALPTFGVALAYGPWMDPTYEMTQAAPYSAIRLVFLRTVVVLATTVGVVGLTGLVLPGHGTAVLWLLPSAALVTTALAVSAWVPPAWAAAMTGVGWLAGVGLYWRAQGSVDPIFGPAGQQAALVLFVLACLAIGAGRRVHAYDVRRFP